MSSDVLRDTAWVVMVVLAVSLHVVLGYLYAVSGLAVPLPVVLLLLVWWGVLTWWLIRWVRARSWWAALPPVLALATWVLVVLGGGTLLGWSA
jgi:hypothetical protein